MTKEAVLKQEQRYFDRAWDERERHRGVLLTAGEAAAGPNKMMTAVRKDAEAKAANMGGPDDAVAFGRFDRDGESVYVGYHAINSDDRELLVINWQRPAAAPYRQATYQDPQGVTLKRTFETERNRIVDFDDLLFEQLAEAVEQLSSQEQWGIEDALLRDLEAHRSGEMRDIVKTIHASQHEVMSAPVDQLLVLQGGPGTGKTAIGLLRTSWIVSNYNDDFRAEDCLVIGPNPTFTRYIRRVLPGLGDVDVVHRDLRTLGPQPSRGGIEDNVTSALKGQARMAELLRHGLWQRVRFPDKVERIHIGAEGAGPSFTKDEIQTVIGRNAGVPYSIGRAALRNYLQTEGQRRSRRGVDLTAASVDATLERLWPSLSPQAFLRELLSSRDRLLAAADPVDDAFTVSEILLLQRAAQDRVGAEPWTDSDVALLDEAEALINGSGSVAIYSHILVDEAQDLTPMQLRSIKRRSRSGSITIAGDIAQSTGAGARDDWSDVVEALAAGGPASIHELGLGYRVPRQVYEFAQRLLPLAAPGVTPPRVVRIGPADPDLVNVATNAMARAAVSAARSHAGAGRFVGIICPQGLRDEVIREFDAQEVQWSDVTKGELGQSINLASPEESKGLEFDAVVVVDPTGITTSSPRGHRLLYIALTRTTTYLTVVHDGVALPLGVEPDTARPSNSEVRSIEEPPAPGSEIANSAVTSSAFTGLPGAPGDGERRRPLQQSPRVGAKLDRVVRLTAADLAAEVRDSLLPAKYAEFIEAMRRELDVDVQDVLDLLED